MPQTPPNSLPGTHVLSRLLDVWCYPEIHPGPWGSSRFFLPPQWPPLTFCLPLHFPSYNVFRSEFLACPTEKTDDGAFKMIPGRCKVSHFQDVDPGKVWLRNAVNYTNQFQKEDFQQNPAVTYILIHRNLSSAVSLCRLRIRMLTYSTVKKN